MRNFKFAWMSDSHVGYRQYGLERREQDFRRAFTDAIKIAISTGCEFIIHSGDIIHSSRPSSTTVTFLQEANAMLKEANMAMLTVSGNHDFSEPHWISTINPGNSEPGIILLDNGRYTPLCQPGFVVCGLPWLTREQFLARGHKDMNADVVIWHGAIQEFTYPSASTIKMEELPLEGVQLWAAGDLHVNKVVHYNAKTWVGYPGSTEMNSETEDEVKVVKIVSVKDQKIVGFEDHKIATRPAIKISITEEQQVAAHIEQLQKCAAGVDKSPIVYIKYPFNIGINIMERFKAVLNPDEFVLRPDPVAMKAVEGGDYVSVLDQELTPADLLETLLDPSSPILPVARKLIDPNNRAEEVIDQFIDAACA